MKKEISKKVVALTLFVLILTTYFTVLVLAQTEGDIAATTATSAATTGAKGFSRVIQRLIDGVGEVGNPVFSTLFGTYTNGGDLTLQFLSFLLVIFIVYGILTTSNILGSSNWIKIGIGTVVAIIGIRFIPPGFLEQAALSSSSFVVVLVAGLPFVLMFFLVKDWESPAARKAAWVFYGVVMFLIWAYYTADDSENIASYIYLLTILGCVILFILDGTLSRWWGQAGAARAVQYATNTQRDKIVADIAQLQEALRVAPTKKDATRIKGEIDRKQDALNTL